MKKDLETPPEPDAVVSMVTHNKRSSSLFFHFASSLVSFVAHYQTCCQLEVSVLVRVGSKTAASS